MTEPDDRRRNDGRFFRTHEFQMWRPLSAETNDLSLELAHFVREARQVLANVSNDDVDDLAHYAKAQATLIHDLRVENYYLYRDESEAFAAALFSPESQLLSRLPKPAEHYFAALALQVAARARLRESDATYGEIGAAIRWMRVALMKLGPFAEPSAQAASKLADEGCGIHARAETTYLNIIGGLLELMLGRTPAGKPQSAFDSQAAIADALLAHYSGQPGISKRTLDEKFPQARKSISQ